MVVQAFARRHRPRRSGGAGNDFAAGRFTAIPLGPFCLGIDTLANTRDHPRELADGLALPCVSERARPASRNCGTLVVRWREHRVMQTSAPDRDRFSRSAAGMPNE